MPLPSHRAHRVQGHGPHHPVLPAWLQLVEVPICEQQCPVPAFAEAIHLQDGWFQGHCLARGLPRRYGWRPPLYEAILSLTGLELKFLKFKSSCETS